jgi:nucleotide-binding universal stress UspA family protein
MGSGPVVVGYDGSPAAERALREAAPVIAPRRVLVVTVWEAGRAFEALTLPTATLGPPTTVDVRAALEVERTMFEAAERTAELGAALARDLGLESEGHAVADEVTVADTLVRLTEERDAGALVVGSHGHRGLSELLVGSTTKDVLRRADCPVIVVRSKD